MHPTCLARSLVLAGFMLLSGCASLPDNSAKEISSAWSSPEETSIGASYNSLAKRYPAGQSGFHILPNGVDAFVARAVLAQVAERSIDSQYYMVHEDQVGILYMDQLLQAADRGVRVRFLLDDIDEGARDFKLALFDFHPNFEVRVFNPFGRNVSKNIQFLSGFGKQTRRAHNKSFTVDNIVSILGGRNIGDEYFADGKDIDFADMDVISVGPVAPEVSASFDRYWNSELSYPISLLVETQPTETDYIEARERLAAYIEEQQQSVYVRRLVFSELADEIRSHSVEFIWADGDVYADPPEKLLADIGDKAYQMLPELTPYMQGATRELVIVSPYFVPGKEGTENLVSLTEKGVRVRVLTNSLSSTDVSIVHAGYARYRKALLRGGVELYELNKKTERLERKAVKAGWKAASKNSLHAKSFVVDRQHVFIGSMNLDPRSIEQNTEIGVLIDSAQLGGQMAGRFERHVEQVAFRLELEKDSEGLEHLRWHGRVDGEDKVFTEEPFTGFWQRFVTGFLRIMPIESQI